MGYLTIEGQRLCRTAGSGKTRAVLNGVVRKQDVSAEMVKEMCMEQGRLKMAEDLHSCFHEEVLFILSDGGKMGYIVKMPQTEVELFVDAVSLVACRLKNLKTSSFFRKAQHFR